MTKKQYIITLLSRLGQSWALAQPLADLIEHTEVDAQFIDGLCALLMEAVHEVHDQVQRDKLTQSQNILKKIQSQTESDTFLLDEELQKELENI